MNINNNIKYYRVSAEVAAEKLRRVLEDMPGVKIAVLFGSVMRRRPVRDVDVAVCLDSKVGLRDLARMANVLEDALGLGVPVDVVPLREAPPKLRLKALLEGLKLVIRDSRLYAYLISQALSEAMDLDVKLREVDRLPSPMGDGAHLNRRVFEGEKRLTLLQDSLESHANQPNK